MVTNIVGPAGPQGSTGLTGATGPAGPTGAQGTQGLTGATGPTGPTGAQGTQGLTGATGATGPVGTNGTNGATGPTGPQGPAGANGTNGAIGPTGPQGATGAAGATGPVGGSNTQLIYNNAGAAAGAALYYNNSNGYLGLGISPPVYPLDVNGAVRATIFYDYNNTAFYLDPASTSMLNTVEASILYDRNNTAYYLQPSQASMLNTVEAAIYYDRNNTTYYLQPSGTSVLDTLRASIFYDRDNTAYYLDPSSAIQSGVLNGNLWIYETAYNTGIRFGSRTEATSASNWAVVGEAVGAGTGTNYGVYANGNGPTGSANYGIWAYAGGGSTNWAGYFSGNVYSTGTFTSSDEKLKKNIEPVSDALSKVLRLRGRTYDFRTDEFPKMGLTEGKKYGLIAQELEQVFPDMVTEVPLARPHDPHKEDNTGTESAAPDTKETIKAINYTELIPVLIEAIKEQQKTIDDLKAEVEGRRK